MGMSLEEYAVLHPQQESDREREAIAASAQSYRERQRELEQGKKQKESILQERERAEQLKESILQQLEQGNAPEIILYTALNAIGLLSSDPKFTEAGQQFLDTVYADLAQQSLLTDNAAVAAHRLDNMQRDYNKRLKNSLTRQLNGYRRIADALNKALQAVEELDPPKEDIEG